MSTDRFCFRNFHSRKLLVVLCSFVIVVIIGLGCGAWIMSEEKQVTLSVNGKSQSFAQTGMAQWLTLSSFGGTEPRAKQTMFFNV